MINNAIISIRLDLTRKTVSFGNARVVSTQFTHAFLTIIIMQLHRDDNDAAELNSEERAANSCLNIPGGHWAIALSADCCRVTRIPTYIHLRISRDIVPGESSRRDRSTRTRTLRVRDARLKSISLPGARVSLLVRESSAIRRENLRGERKRKSAWCPQK